MHEELLHLIRERGLLLEKEVFDLLSSFDNVQAAKSFLEGLERYSGQKMITKATLSNHASYVRQVVSHLPGKDKASVENTIVTLGVHPGMLF